MLWCQDFHCLYAPAQRWHSAILLKIVILLVSRMWHFFRPLFQFVTFRLFYKLFRFGLLWFSFHDFWRCLYKWPIRFRNSLDLLSPPNTFTTLYFDPFHRSTRFILPRSHLLLRVNFVALSSLRSFLSSIFSSFYDFHIGWIFILKRSMKTFNPLSTVQFTGLGQNSPWNCVYHLTSFALLTPFALQIFNIFKCKRKRPQQLFWMVYFHFICTVNFANRLIKSKWCYQIKATHRT